MHRKTAFLHPFRSALFTLFFILLCAAPGTSGEKSPSPPRILILNSYHQGYTWSDREMEGIINTLQHSGLSPEIHTEFLDSKYFPKNDHFEQFYNLISFKYGKQRPSVVITLDNSAFEFAVQYRKSLFNQIPIVFAGINDFERSMLKGETAITGVVENQDVVGTVNCAKLVHPDLKEVLILHDFTSSGLGSRREAEEDSLKVASLGIKFRYLPEMTIDEVSETVKALKPGTIVLPFSFSRDKNGRILTHAEFSEIVSKKAPVPVYSTKMERLGHGVLGGSLLEGRTHGAESATIALRILRGESADAIPVNIKPKTVTMFDRTVMNRFGVSPDVLPPGSKMINDEPGFYRQHGRVINVSLGVVLVVCGSAFFIVMANRRRVQAEMALLRVERSKTAALEAANSEMESFLYAVSHDLQAPLRRIKSYSTILADEYASTLDSQALFYLARVKAGSSDMSLLISDILALANISKTELSRIRCNLGDLALVVFNGMEPDLGPRRITFTADDGMIAYADRPLIIKVLGALLANACKFTNHVPETAIIHLGSYSEGQRTVFFLRDNGIGFDMQYSEKLFAPFQRLHAEQEYEGNGIGLAIVQRIIVLHGGKIWAESAPGKGATFYFTLKP